LVVIHCYSCRCLYGISCGVSSLIRDCVNASHATLESVKAVSDLVAAVSGTVEEVNEEAQSQPELLNEDPYEKGWLVIVKPSNLQADLANLMDFDKAVEWHKNQSK